MKTLKEQIAEGVEELGAIPFFPSEQGARFGIMRALEKFVSGPHELRWLIDTAVGRMREWRGPAELRGLYCTRFKPADGKEEYCTIPGFTADDCEASHALLPVGPELPRSNKLLASGVVAEMLDGQCQKIGIFQVGPSPRADEAAEEGLRHNDAKNRFASIVHQQQPPIHIPGTPKRTPEENAALEQELRERLNPLRRERAAREVA